MEQSGFCKGVDPWYDRFAARVHSMGNITEREHEIGIFDELVCRGGGTVHLGSGPEPKLVVIGPPDLVNRVVVRYRGTRLVVSFRVGPDPARYLGMGSDSVRTIVITDALSKVTVQGVAHLVLGDGPEQPFTSDAVTLINSGTGSVRGAISARELSVRVRGMGGVELAGDAEVLDARVPGMGSLNCIDLVCKRAKVTMSGMGNGSLMVLDELTAVMNGTGRLKYRGTALITARGASPHHVDHVE